ncbi:MAG: NADPH-dependent FMN reductase [Sphingobacteriaceae bacterium]
MEKIIVFSCTNRPQSYTSKVSKLYLDLLKNKGIECELFSFEHLPKDMMFTEMFGNRSTEFEQLIAKFIRPNNKFIFIMPEYNGGFPGILKVFLDCVHPREWTDKKACLVGVSSGRGGNIRGLEQLTGVLNYLKVNIYHHKLPISLIDKHMNEMGNFTAPEQLKICEMQLDGYLKF